MLRCLSTHLFLKERLHPGLLELAARSGAEAVEIFAARQHFDYTSREHVHELAAWFASNPLEAWSMHAPLFPDREMGRAGAPAVNLLHPEKSRRIDAMDEVKRALETAEHIHFKNLVLHLGELTDTWSPRTQEHALTASNTSDAFAQPLGVRLLAENLVSEPTTPEHLMEVLDSRPSHPHRHLPRPGPRPHHGRHPGGNLHIRQPYRLGPCPRQPRHRDEHLWPGDGRSAIYSATQRPSCQSKSKKHSSYSTERFSREATIVVAACSV
jgi:hypothetical protein